MVLFLGQLSVSSASAGWLGVWKPNSMNCLIIVVYLENILVLNCLVSKISLKFQCSVT